MTSLPEYAGELLEALLDMKTNSEYMKSTFRRAHEGETLAVTLMLKAPEFGWTVEFAFEEVQNHTDKDALPDYMIIWRLIED